METLPTKIDNLRSNIDAEFDKIYKLTVDGILQWRVESGNKFVLQRPCDIEPDIFPNVTLYAGISKRNVMINEVVIDLSPGRIDKICNAAAGQNELNSIGVDLTNSLVSLREFTEVFEKE